MTKWILRPLGYLILAALCLLIACGVACGGFFLGLIITVLHNG